MKGLPENMSQTVIDLNKKKLMDEGVILSETPTSDPQKPSKADVKAEKELQVQVENWLHHRGYHRRSPSWLNNTDPVPPRGWQIHLHKTKQNPILLDILILGNNGTFMELELKVKGGKVSDEQEILLKGENQRIAWGFRQATILVAEWEGSLEILCVHGESMDGLCNACADSGNDPRDLVS